MTAHDGTSVPEPSAAEVTDVVVRYADGTASEEDMVRLNHWLITFPTACELFARVYLQISVLSERARGREDTLAAASFDPTRLRGNDASTVDTSLWSSSWFRRFGIPVGVALAMLVGLAVSILINAGGQNPGGSGELAGGPLAIESVELIQGMVTRQFADGTQEQLTSSSRLRPGDRVVTTGDRSLVILRCADGSKIAALGNTDVVLPETDGSRFNFRRGLMMVSARPQRREQPLVIDSRTAELTVLGTRFAVQQSRGTTELVVFSGKVSMKDTSFGRTQVVTAGRLGRIVGASPLDVQPIPEALTDFREGFESRIPPGGSGERVGNGDLKLPRGSRGAARAAFSDRDADGDVTGHYRVAVRSTDLMGLCKLKNTSHLQIVCRLERLDRVHLYLGAMLLEPNNPRHFHYRYDRLHEDVGTAGDWVRVTIPLEELKSEPAFGSGVFNGPSPDSDMTPVSVEISSPATQSEGDRGIVVDSIAILADGPGKVFVELLP